MSGISKPETMKNLALAFGLLLTVPTIMIGQEATAPIEIQEEPKVSKRLTRMTETLQLTPTQVDQVRSIHKNYKPHLENARIIEDKAKKKEAIFALKNAELQEVKQILSPEQLPLLEEHLAKQKAVKVRGGARKAAETQDAE
ncbi:MAG TPA: hypothetical protein DCX14_11425 [Flavobacteriales bacterium]|jgi:hypothetical protein|nr:hypothetical protein [Flavobacteriales bacterium]